MCPDHLIPQEMNSIREMAFEHQHFEFVVKYLDFSLRRIHRKFNLLFQEECPSQAKNAMNTLFACRCFGWTRDNCFTTGLYRLLHGPRLHNLSFFAPLVFVIV